MQAMQIDTQRGFSLLEAIVALVILAGSCMALFAWINSSLVQLQRAELYVEAGPAIVSASQYLKTVDLTQRPEGSFQSGRVAVDWAAKPIELEVSRPAAYGGSNFLLSLYQVSLTAHTPDRSLPSLQTRIVNYRLKPGLPDPNNGL
ncbi:prepilin-type N-terminal cleavage/methylation domain-containing protein [Stutzerimonas stutzeri]|uniref:prepilin-type N-terminal cleavage/methylation domain-containing protein n=1 Tax=Stutzerimonas stutzeri TaxID=316 RepID=UPI000EED843E|nr:prepilin-type N-terminal cleavage/methylation domain-containing protein [Stutzerimonas stutzeri]MDH1668762.1 prepilin-type N-terminal cleavage/methylation domain-containing protein [Stutzerimonas stutzeri]HAN52814.1 prepilin-type cleavage/methylation domain-containing protein [Pseudomonas sp.]